MSVLGMAAARVFRGGVAGETQSDGTNKNLAVGGVFSDARIDGSASQEPQLSTEAGQLLSLGLFARLAQSYEKSQRHVEESAHLRVPSPKLLEVGEFLRLKNRIEILIRGGMRLTQAAEAVYGGTDNFVSRNIREAGLTPEGITSPSQRWSAYASSIAYAADSAMLSHKDWTTAWDLGVQAFSPDIQAALVKMQRRSPETIAALEKKSLAATNPEIRFTRLFLAEAIKSGDLDVTAFRRDQTRAWNEFNRTFNVSDDLVFTRQDVAAALDTGKLAVSLGLGFRTGKGIASAVFNTLGRTKVAMYAGEALGFTVSAASAPVIRGLLDGQSPTESLANAPGWQQQAIQTAIHMATFEAAGVAAPALQGAVGNLIASIKSPAIKTAAQTLLSRGSLTAAAFLGLSFYSGEEPGKLDGLPPELATIEPGTRRDLLHRVARSYARALGIEAGKGQRINVGSGGTPAGAGSGISQLLLPGSGSTNGGRDLVPVSAGVGGATPFVWPEIPGDAPGNIPRARNLSMAMVGGNQTIGGVPREEIENQLRLEIEAPSSAFVGGVFATSPGHHNNQAVVERFDGMVSSLRRAAELRGIPMIVLHFDDSKVPEAADYELFRNLKPGSRGAAWSLRVKEAIEQAGGNFATRQPWAGVIDVDLRGTPPSTDPHQTMDLWSFMHYSSGLGDRAIVVIDGYGKRSFEWGLMLPNDRGGAGTMLVRTSERQREFESGIGGSPALEQVGGSFVDAESIGVAVTPTPTRHSYRMSGSPALEEVGGESTDSDNVGWHPPLPDIKTYNQTRATLLFDALSAAQTLASSGRQVAVQGPNHFGKSHLLTELDDLLARRPDSTVHCYKVRPDGELQSFRAFWRGRKEPNPGDIIFVDEYGYLRPDSDADAQVRRWRESGVRVIPVVPGNIQAPAGFELISITQGSSPDTWELHIPHQ